VQFLGDEKRFHTGWVQTGSVSLSDRRLLYLGKRTSIYAAAMSEKCQFQTHAPQQTATLFDHLVSALLKLQGT
jgi:hypothetical protein